MKTASILILPSFAFLAAVLTATAVGPHAQEAALRLLSLEQYKDGDETVPLIQMEDEFVAAIRRLATHEEHFQFYRGEPISLILRGPGGGALDATLIDAVMQANGSKDEWQLEYETELESPYSLFQGWLRKDGSQSIQVIYSAAGSVRSIELRDEQAVRRSDEALLEGSGEQQANTISGN